MVFLFRKCLLLKKYNYFLLLPADTVWKLQPLQGAKEPKETLSGLNPKDVKGILAQLVLQSIMFMQWSLIGLAGLILQITLHIQIHGAKNFTSTHGLCELRALRQKADCWTKTLNCYIMSNPIFKSTC